MIEALYFQTYYAYLLGDLQKAKMFFDFLQDEFKKKKDPKALSLRRLKELKKIRSAILTGKIESISWVCENDSPSMTNSENPDIKQTELVRKIHYEGIDSLREHLNSPMASLYNIEHPCGDYGAVDMVYSDAETVFPVEVKRHEGKHDLIGQISKYTLYFKLRLHIKHYEGVQPVTICKSYNQHTLTELKRISVITLIYNLIEDKVKLKRI